MSAKTKIAVAAVAVLIALPLHSAAAPLPLPYSPPPAEASKGGAQQWSGNMISGAYAATNKSRRTTRPASRNRVSQATDPSFHVRAPDGRDLGTDPDAAIRFQLRRDSSMGGM
jgi:hypothetical protein